MLDASLSLSQLPLHTGNGQPSPVRPKPPMNQTERCSSRAVSVLSEQLAIFQQRQFTGRLDIRVGDRTWYLYLALGRFAWAGGGAHATRRWRRQMMRSSLFAEASKLRPRENDRFECWDYQILTILAKRQIASSEQAIAVICGVVTEVLFEIVQAIDLASHANGRQNGSTPPGDLARCYEIVPRLGMRPSTTDTAILPRAWTVEIEPALKLTRDVWQRWVAAGLARCSPNLAPVLRQPQQLQQQTSAKTYQTLSEVANGKRSLRDVAVLVKKDLLGLTRSLSPYISQQAIGLVEIPDLPLPPFARCTSDERPERAALKPSSSSTSALSSRRGLIVCIDDNPQIGHTMSELLEQAGYQLIVVQEAIQSLPTLLQHKPDLIFLDLVMPIASGYEICTQIRRVTALKETPVIILTGNDGIVDRVRAKMVGATDFLTKPIDAEKVLAIAAKYLQPSPTDGAV